MPNNNGLTSVVQTFNTGSADTNLYIRKGETVTLNNLEVDGMITIKNGQYDGTIEVTGTGNDSYLILQSDYVQLGNASSATPHVQVLGSAGAGTVYDSLYNPPSSAPYPILNLSTNTNITLTSAQLQRLIVVTVPTAATPVITLPNAAVGTWVKILLNQVESESNAQISVVDPRGTVLMDTGETVPDDTQLTTFVAYAQTGAGPLTAWASDFQRLPA